LLGIQANATATSNSFNEVNGNSAGPTGIGVFGTNTAATDGTFSYSQPKNLDTPVLSGIEQYEFGFTVSNRTLLLTLVNNLLDCPIRRSRMLAYESSQCAASYFS